MKTWHKILIGGLGALTPILMNLLVLDVRILVELTLFGLLGYAIRVVILFYLGGLVAFLHKDEKSPVKLFELGIVAPALITAMLNAGQVEVPNTAKPQNRTASVFFIPAAHAQDSRKEEIKTFSLPQGSPADQFWRGFTGSSSKKVWFVITSSNLTLEDAKREAQKINRKGQDFQAEVYVGYGKNQIYEVVIGANLTYEEAQNLRQRAMAAGLPQEIHLWTFPK